MEMPLQSPQVVPAATANRLRSFTLYAFVLSVILPVQMAVFLGTMRISPYRFVLLLALIPLLLGWVTGKLGHRSATDGLVAAHTAWAVCALLISGPPGETWQPAGMYAIEATGAYLLARYCIQSAQAYETLLRIWFIVLLALLPIAFVEAYSSIYLQTLIWGETMYLAAEEYMRLGLHRAYTVFQHPIHYGVFAASLIGMALYPPRTRTSVWRGISRLGAAGTSVFLSLSSGPLSALGAQLLLAVWERATRRLPSRTAVLWTLVITAYIAIDLISTRSPFKVIISYVALNADTAYGRVQIWEHGILNVIKRPLFGLGIYLEDWERPEEIFTSGSMDAFWLVPAVAYGLPAALFLVGAVVCQSVRVARFRSPDPGIARARLGWLISLVGLSIAGVAVHYWAGIFCWFMFLLGAAEWMLRPAQRDTDAGADGADPDAADTRSIPPPAATFVLAPATTFIPPTSEDDLAVQEEDVTPPGKEHGV